MVMVVQSFINLYGREPTPEEIGKMMELKARIDSQRNSLMAPNKYNPEMKSPAQKSAQQCEPKKRKPRPPQPSVQGKQINRMIKCGISIDKISYILDLQMSEVEYQIKRHNLPRQDIK